MTLEKARQNEARWKRQARVFQQRGLAEAARAMRHRAANWNAVVTKLAQSLNPKGGISF